MHSSVKGFEFICNIERGLIEPSISNTPVQEKNNNFSKYFDFFRTSNETAKSNENHVNENMQRLKDMFNNKR